MVETFFEQMCDQLNLKRNYAKSYEGLGKIDIEIVLNVNPALD